MGVFFLVLIGFAIAIQAFLLTAAGQTFLVSKLTDYVQRNYGIEAQVDRIKLSLFDRVHVQDVYVLDDRQDTILAVQEIEVHLSDILFTETENTLALSEVRLIEPYFNLYKLEQDSLTNLGLLLSRFPESEADTSSSEFSITLKSLVISQGRFRWSDYHQFPKDGGIDWSHLDITGIDLELSDAMLDGDTIEAQLEQVALEDHSGFQVTRFSGKAHYDPTRISVDELAIRTPRTRVQGTYSMRYDSLADLSDFLTKVKLRAKLKECMIHAGDIAFFAPDLAGLEDSVRFSGNVKGTIANLAVKKVDLGFGSETILRGNFDLNGLPDINNTFISINLKELRTTQADLRNIPVPPFTQKKRLELPDFLSRMGVMEFDGRFTGFITDFVAYGNFNSDLGYVRTDVKLARGAGNRPEYRGKVKTTNLDLGALAANKALGKVSLNLSVDGRDFDLDKIYTQFGGTVNKITVNDYTYRDISLKGELQQRLFSGSLAIHDENVRLQFEGDMELTDDNPLFKFTAEVEGAYPVRLNLMEGDSSFRVDTRVVFNFRGNSINNILGRASLEQLRIERKGDVYATNYVNFLAYGTPEGKTLALESERVNAYVSGDFNTVRLPEALNYMSYRIFPSVYEEAPLKPKEDERFEFAIRISELEDATRLFLGNVILSDSLDLTGSFDLASEQVKIDAYVAELDLFGIRHDSLTFRIRDIEDSISFVSSVREVALSDSAVMHKVHLNANAHLDEVRAHIDWDNGLEQENYSGDVNLMAHTYSPELFKVDVLKSSVVISDSLWEVSNQNYILFDRGEIYFHNLRLSEGEQFVFVDGGITNYPDDQLTIEVQQVELEEVSRLFMPGGLSLKGVINGKVTLQNIGENLTFNSNIDLNGLQLNEYVFGDGHIRTDYIKEEKDLKLEAWMTNQGQRIIDIKGNYLPDQEEDNINMLARFRELPLENIQPLLKDYVTQLGGSIYGRARLSGKASEPDISGNINLSGIQANVVYTNTFYRIPSGKIFLDNGLIGADQLPLIDAQGRKAAINLSMFHQNFSNLTYDIWLYANDGLQVLNTDETMNEIFYGKAFLAPKSSVTVESGVRGKVVLRVDATTGRNTQLFIPLGGSSESEEIPYLHFVDWDAEKEDTIKVIRQTSSSGFELAMDMQVTPDAEFQLIFDKVSGDVIRAQGSGDIALNIDDKGRFQIFGTYEIQEGDYLFTLENIINKRFDVRPGSSITWDGDATTGLADITASYSLRTNLYDLGLQLSSDTNELKRRIPVDLLLNLSGNYLNPEFDFGFDLPDRYDDYESVLMNLEDGEQNKQVFGLLLLNKFFPVSQGFANLGGNNNALGKSSSEVISNQLSNWLTQISDEVDIGVNYTPGDDITAQEVEVMLSTQLWNDRVTLETNIGVQGNDPNATQQSSQVVGDFLLEYKVTSDGSVRGKAFNRSNTFDPVNETQAPYTQGVGIMYREDFNSIHHLGCRIRRKFTSKERREQVDCVKREIERMRLKEEKNKQKQLNKETT